MSEGVWYRYEDRYEDARWDDDDAKWSTDGPVKLKIVLREIRVDRATKCGVFLQESRFHKPRFVLFPSGKGRRWAYPTKEDALMSYKFRKEHQRGHGRRTVERAEEALALIAALP